MESISTILRYFSGNIYKALLGFSGKLCEIRLRANEPLSVTTLSGYLFLRADGTATDNPSEAVKVTLEDIRKSFEAICRYSVHSCQNQINSGFITVSGGHRAGICGTAVYSPKGRIDNIKYINSINFRVATQVIGAADIIIKSCMKGDISSVLIFGQVCSGKTTILRDLCRSVGNKYPVSLIDERGEIAAVSGGNANNKIGANTDVFSGFTKADGIISSVRVMSPRMIVCDEIGSADDIDALKLAKLSGVKISATIHSSSIDELRQRKEITELFEQRIFDYAVFVSEREVTRIYAKTEVLQNTQRKGGNYV